MSTSGDPRSARIFRPTGPEVTSNSYGPGGTTHAATKQFPQPHQFANGYQDPTGR
jgi:hypothetical protein